MANGNIRALFLAGAALVTAGCGENVPSIAEADRVALTRADIGKLPPIPTVAVETNGATAFSTPTGCLGFALLGRNETACVDSQTGNLLFKVAPVPADTRVPVLVERQIYADKAAWAKLTAAPKS